MKHIGICAKIADMFALTRAQYVVSLTHTSAKQIVILKTHLDMGVINSKTLNEE